MSRPAVDFLTHLRRSKLALPAEFRGGEVAPSPGATIMQTIPPWLGWLLDIRGMAESTIGNYGLDARSFALYAERQGVVFAHAVDHRLIERYLQDILRGGAARSTAIRHFYALRNLFRYLEREGIVPRNPTATAFAPKAQPRRLPDGWLRTEEYGAVIRALKRDGSLRGRRNLAMIAVPLMAGLRCAETVQLRVEDVDLTLGQLRVRHGKGDRERFVTLVKPLRAILHDYIENVRPALINRPAGSLRRPRGSYWHLAYVAPGGRRVVCSTGTKDEAEARRMLLTLAPAPPDAGWLFVREGRYGLTKARAAEPMTFRMLSMLVHQQLPGILGRRVWTHLLRHSFASRLRTNGAPLDTIKEELGHARLDTTLIYSHLTTEQRRREVERYFRGRAR
jgi:integrase/recombinase XerC